MQALSAAGPDDAYTPEGYQHYPLRTFLTPMEQTARLSKMHYAPPYTLYGALRAPDGSELERHVDGYVRLLTALRDDTFDHEASREIDVMHHDNLPIQG